MSILTRLFGKSPFAPLQAHMEKVGLCVHMLPKLFEAMKEQNMKKIHDVGKKISKLEHDADLTKNDLRNHLPKSLFLPIDRSLLLEILSLQDAIADKAEDISVIATFRTLDRYDIFKDKFDPFCNKTIEAYNLIEKVIHEFDDLLETSFGGAEAEKVKDMIQEVAKKEHELDLLQFEILKKLFNMEKEISFQSFYLWTTLVREIGEISNLAEKLAHRIRMILDLK